MGGTRHPSSALLGAAPTGNAIEVNGINLYRVAEGKIAEAWQLTDLAGLLRQLGILELKDTTA
jgi:predicted ester cyclase